MRQEHHKFGYNTFSKGANTDLDKEYLGAQDRGQYIDARNMRPTDIDGKNGISKKIKGEQVVFNFQPVLSSNYVCVGSTMVFDHVICLWASDTGGDTDCITIDGQIVAQSNLLSFRTDRPFQIDTNESCIGGEIFITDNEEVPRIFNVQDMIDAYSVGSQKYFSDYNPSLYSVNLQTSFNIPVFKELYPASGAGLPVGSYTYSFRYVSADGDVTNWSPETPPIPVVENLDIGNSRWPHATTQGAQPNLSLPTSFGIRLKFRVNNFYNYDSVEIKRRSWNSDVGPNFTPQSEIIVQLSINPNEVSVRTFDDPSNSNVDNDPVDDQEDVEVTRAIRTAKAIRYYDRRLVLMNISYESPDFEPTLSNPQNKPNFVIQDIGTDGHKDPWKSTYRKSYQRGERFSFGLVGYDGLGSPSFAFEPSDYSNVRFPNRRENTTNFPLNPQVENVNQPVTASDIDRNIEETFEVFDMSNAVRKTDVDTFKNILSLGGKFSGSVNDDSSTLGDDTSPESQGATQTFDGRWRGPYSPYRPTINNKASTDGHNYRVNTYVNSAQEYDPKGFAPSYKSLGVSIGSISNIPSWVKAVSVGRSKRAGRVVAQGIATYKITPHGSGFFDEVLTNAQLDTKKSRNTLKFYSPDIDAGFFDSSTFASLNQNSPFKVQFVSPLGFFSEVYNHHNFNNTLLLSTDRVVDMVSYARIYNETGEINPLTNGGNSYHVKYGEWAETPTNPSAFIGTNRDGNRIFDIQSVQAVSEGRGNHFEITLPTNIYEDGSPRKAFEDLSNAGTKFLEPWYIVNIILDEEQVQDEGINEYINTGTFIKTESLIGIGNGGSQVLELVDERWEDCCATIYTSSPTSSTSFESYVFIENTTTGTIQRWLDVTDHTPAQVTSIINDISSNGFHTTGAGTQIYGVYTTSRTNDESNVSLNFTNPGSYVPEEAKIYVRYDDRRPIKVFGGDTTIHESIFAPIDREATGENNSTQKDAQFRLGIGLPYSQYFITPRHYVVRNTSGINRIQDSFFLGVRKSANLFHIRQWCNVFTAESRVSIPYMYQGSAESGGKQFYGNTHYVMRPNQFDDDFTSLDPVTIYETNNNLHTGYKDDYGDEYLQWKWGGFKFLPSYNQDYMAEGSANLLSKPKFGFIERDSFCTGIAWSLRRATNQQQAPGLKTFPPSNFFVITDRQGPIVKAFDAQGSKGDNLYAITTRGVCLLITNKDVLRDANAGEIGYMESESFIAREYWIEKGIGMDDEMWRLSAEGLASYPSEMGNNRLETLFFAGRESVYKLVNNKVYDIGSLDYYSEIRTFLQYATKGLDEGRMAGYYDSLNDEYFMQLSYKKPLDRDPLEIGFAFSQKNNSWNGKYDFRHDFFASRDQNLFGLKEGQVYKLNEGYVINGQPIESWLKVAFANDMFDEKEFIRIRVNGDKPKKIQFLDENDLVMCELSQASKGPLYLKKYDGWEQFIPRKQASYDVNEHRVQNRLLVYKIIHTFEEEFNVKNVVIQYKILK